MSRTKIAPVLAALLDDLLDTAKLPGDAQVLRIARAEAKALRRVARAAGPGHECGAGAKPARCALCRALDSLRRASGAPSRNARRAK